jgi:hypothetical integral membrane protein (TIGR02206 family)
MMLVRFLAFGPSHLAALAAVALGCALLVALVRRWPRLALGLRLLLALGLVALVGYEIAVGVREGWVGWKTLLPLELCDAALLLAVAGLLAPRRWLAEIVYFWAGAGSLLAMLTPELHWDFPRWEFVVFFGLHGLVIAAAMLLVFGLGLWPRPGAPLRLLGITAAWASLAGLVNLALGTNFMYLRHKPSVVTLLDWMGPWPIYILSSAVLAYLLFELLSLPFRPGWRAARQGR